MTGPEHYRRPEELLADIPREIGATLATRGGVKYQPTYVHQLHLPTIALA
jgi:hypothetical protein